MGLISLSRRGCGRSSKSSFSSCERKASIGSLIAVAFSTIRADVRSTWPSTDARNDRSTMPNRKDQKRRAWSWQNLENAGMLFLLLGCFSQAVTSRRLRSGGNPTQIQE